MPAQVDGAGCDMDVHEVVDCAALDVVLHSVHHVACAHVKDLDVGQVAGPDPSRSKGSSGADAGRLIPRESPNHTCYFQAPSTTCFHKMPCLAMFWLPVLET